MMDNRHDELDWFDASPPSPLRLDADEHEDHGHDEAPHRRPPDRNTIFAGLLGLLIILTLAAGVFLGAFSGTDADAQAAGQDEHAQALAAARADDPGKRLASSSLGTVLPALPDDAPNPAVAPAAAAPAEPGAAKAQPAAAPAEPGATRTEPAAAPAEAEAAKVEPAAAPAEPEAAPAEPPAAEVVPTEAETAPAEAETAPAESEPAKAADAPAEEEPTALPALDLSGLAPAGSPVEAAPTEGATGPAAKPKPKPKPKAAAKVAKAKTTRTNPPPRRVTAVDRSKKDPPAKAIAPAPKPETPAPDKPVKASGDVKEVLTKARQYSKAGRLKKALAEYNRAVKMAPGSSAARYGLGRTLYDLGQVAKAEAEFKQILKWSPRHRGALKWMGSIAQERGRRAEARKYYERYLATNPKGRAAANVARILQSLQ